MKQEERKTKNFRVDMGKVMLVQELWQLAKNNNTTAFLQLAEILKIKERARKYSFECRQTSSSTLEASDLEQDLMLCLLRCIRMYDNSKTQAPFYAYAVRALKNECGKSKKKSFAITYTLYGAMKLASEIAAASHDEYAVPIVATTSSFIRVEAFPMYQDEDGGKTQVEFPADEMTVEDTIEQEIIYGEIRKMVHYIEDEVEREIIQMKYGFHPYKYPHSASEIAKKITGISERLVYSTVNRVLCRLIVEHSDLLMSA